MESSQKIKNNVEGPQQKQEIHVSKKEYLEQFEANKDHYSFVYSQILKQLQPSILKDAVQSAFEEKEARKKHGHYTEDILTEQAKKYAFRGIIRRSDNLPTYIFHPQSTLDTVDESIYLRGIDAPGEESPEHITPGYIWDGYAFPDPAEVNEYKWDVAIIQVYKNEPFILATNPGDTTTKLYKGPSADPENISVEDAIRKGYPTLRDIYIGQIVVHLDSE